MSKKVADLWDILLEEERQCGGSLSRKTYHGLMRAAGNLADNGMKFGLERVQLPPEALKILLELADGTRERPASRPPMRPIDKLRHWKVSRMRLAARDIDRYEDVWRKRYGRRNVHDEALQKAAAHWSLDPKQLESFYKRK